MNFVFDFGISGYQPRWLQGRKAITEAHGHRLAALAGRTLRHIWLVWDLGADEWFADGPVLLDFGDEQVEINHQKSDDVSITFNSIDLTKPVVWPTSPGFQLAWRQEPQAQLVSLPGQQLRYAELLEWIGGTIADHIAVGFVLTAGRLAIYNAGDENGLDFDPPGRDWRRHPLDELDAG